MSHVEMKVTSFHGLPGGIPFLAFLVEKAVAG